MTAGTPDRLTKLRAAMVDALDEAVPTSEQDWRAVRIVTVELELDPSGAPTYARAWIEKKVNHKKLGLATED